MYIEYLEYNKYIYIFYLLNIKSHLQIKINFHKTQNKEKSRIPVTEILLLKSKNLSLMGFKFDRFLSFSIYFFNNKD